MHVFAPRTNKDDRGEDQTAIAPQSSNAVIVVIIGAQIGVNHTQFLVKIAIIVDYKIILPNYVKGYLAIKKLQQEGAGTLKTLLKKKYS